jgi:hypothetical protein
MSKYANLDKDTLIRLLRTKPAKPKPCMSITSTFSWSGASAARGIRPVAQAWRQARKRRWVRHCGCAGEEHPMVDKNVNSGHKAEDHFEDILEMVNIGSAKTRRKLGEK